MHPPFLYCDVREGDSWLVGSLASVALGENIR